MVKNKNRNWLSIIITIIINLNAMFFFSILVLMLTSILVEYISSYHFITRLFLSVIYMFGTITILIKVLGINWSPKWKKE